MDKLDPKQHGASPDIVQDNIRKLRELFPDAFTEGSDRDGPRWKVDLDALGRILGEHVEDQRERYSFTWHGKARARQIAQTPSAGTLRPCPEESVNWDTTRNLFIEGDNLEVLKLLQKSYHKRVKMIYIDPPYNTGGEFIYPDRFQDNLDTYLRYTGQIDDRGFKISANSESSGRYHTNWLNMMYPRLRLARNLLLESGSIFISVDDTEVANLRKICDEIFGEENFIANIVWQKKYAKQNDSKGLSFSHDHILLYARDVDSWVAHALPRNEAQLKSYKNPDNHPLGLWQSVVYTCNKTADERPNLYYSITHPGTGEKIWPSRSRVWYCDEAQHQRNVVEGRVWWGLDNEKSKPRLKSFLSEVKEGIVPGTIWFRGEVGDTQESKRRIMELFDGDVAFDTPKPRALIHRMMEIAAPEEDATVLDFFAGSCSTADAVLKFNAERNHRKRFICVQLPEPARYGRFETISKLGIERVIRAIRGIEAERESTSQDGNALGFKTFRLADSNIRPWDPTAGDLKTSLFDAVENIKPDRTEHDVLYELLLKYGLDLAVPMERREIAGKAVHVIGAGALVVCLADKIDLEVVNGIAALKDELTPEIMRVVFKDAGFADDVVKTNTVQILRQAGIEDVKSL